MKKMDETELTEKLGDYVTPHGLYERTKSMPFLGKVTCNVDKLVAGSWDEIILDYEIGASGIADGAWMKVTFKFYSDWALFQTDDATAANYVSAEYQACECVPGQSPATVQSLKVRFDQKGHERPFQKAVIVDTVDGFLKPGDHIIIRLGDRRAGGPGTRVQTFVEKGFRFRCYVDPLGTSRFAAIPGDIVLDIVAGRPDHLRVVAPRIVKTGGVAKAVVSVEDKWGNTCCDLDAAVSVIGVRANTPVYENTVALNNKGWAIADLTDLPLNEDGELALTAKLKQSTKVPDETVYITTDSQLPFPRAFYGDLHVHSDDTVGTNDTTYNLSYGRDVSALDVLGYTANDFNITKARWEHSVVLINELNKDGEFVCYPGTEWCGNSAAGGDHNVVFLRGETPEFPFDRHGNICRSFEWNEDMKGDQIQPGAWPLDELYATYIHDPEGHLLMPHVGGRRCNLDWHHPVLERLVEIESAWGQFPWLYEDAMRRGYKLGAAANSDEHRGRCGGGVPGTAVFGTKGGLTGIIADNLDRVTIGKALRARHTFATTGERSYALTRCGSYIMGDEFKQKGQASITYQLLGDAGWDEVAAYDHSGCFWRRNLHQELGFSERKVRLRWGGARIPDRYRWAAWNGSVTITSGIVNSFQSYGFEHAEETVWRSSPTTVCFKSDTFGDTDSLELDISQLARCRIRIQGTIDGYVKVGNPLHGNPFVHCPTFDVELSGAELLGTDNGQLRVDLGGQELFLSLERMTADQLPRELTGTIDVEARNGPHGFRPVYLCGTQRDGAKVWTSALFIDFLS